VVRKRERGGKKKREKKREKKLQNLHQVKEGILTEHDHKGWNTG